MGKGDNMKIKILCIICFCFFLPGNIGLAEETQEIVRAKVGIKLFSEGEERRAKALERRIRTGDRIQIYVMPEPDPAYIYVVHRDQNAVSWLNSQEDSQKIVNNTILKLPTEDEGPFYTFDGNSTREYITIICSPVEISDIYQLFQDPEDVYEKWLQLEQKFLAQSQIDLSDDIPKPWTVGGAFRDVFTGTLPVLSGKLLVVKKYEFHVKK
jgi:hypothetical protein